MDWSQMLESAQNWLMKEGFKILICVCAVGYLGLDTSGLTALIVSFGVSVGLAINGTLSNLAGRDGRCWTASRTRDRSR